MGIFINPGNQGFKEIKTDNYIDKTSLIACINDTIETERRLTCISRPRRFGKSYAAQMLASYYCTGCDSAPLFDGLEISKDESYTRYMNKYNVLYLDITYFLSEIKDKAELINRIRSEVLFEIEREFPEYEVRGLSLPNALEKLVIESGNKFIAIIDEWDSPIRDNESTKATQKAFLEFMRGLFKNSGLTNKVFAAAYMTGILPVKKDGSQSAISEFKEYSILSPEMFASHTGFTEEDVKIICKKHNVSFEKMKEWYDGYTVFDDNGNSISIYNPNSVMEAAFSGKFKSYWSQSSAASSLIDYINMDYNGLGKDASDILGGKDIKIDVSGFQNSPQDLKSKDDVLTLLVHFGYLNYNPETHMARIPNEEIRQEFAHAVRKVTHSDTIRKVQESDQLIMDTIEGNETAVAAQIQKIHNTEFAPLFYNREISLRSVIKLAYFAYSDNYLKFEELPSGKGFADIVYLPRKASLYPVLVIELKWDEMPKGAIAQINENNYADKFEDFGGGIVLVGISYDKKTKEHKCQIIRYGIEE